VVASADLTVAAGVWNKLELFLAMELFEPLTSQSGGVLSRVRGVRDLTVDLVTVPVRRQSPPPPPAPAVAILQLLALGFFLWSSEVRVRGYISPNPREPPGSRR
jgi:hypothetical protein